MIEPRSPQVVVLLSCLFFALAAVTSAHGQTPVVSDSFNPTSPDRQPGMPVDNAPIERGHGRWKATGGVSFAGGTAVGADESEFASFRFVPVDHQRSAIVVVETDIDPGSEGWVGVGFAGSELGPLPSKGELWVKLHHLGKVIVYADGARIKLYDDSHPNPAFVQGMNQVRLSYNRRLNAARAWLNGQELPLSDLSATGFAPDISSIAFHLWKIEGEGAGEGGGTTPKELEEPLIGEITGGIEEAFLGESFTTTESDPRAPGLPLNGVSVEFGAPELWQATPSVGFGPDYATNVGLGTVAAGLPFELADAPGFATSSVEALINPNKASWVAIGFASSATGGFEADGELWARLHDTGWLQVYADGTLHTLFDGQVVDPEKMAEGVNLKISYNRLTGSVRVWVNEDELNLTQGLGGYTPAISHAGFAAFREGGFEEPERFALDDFAVRFSDAIPPLTIAASPSSTIAVEGWRLSMSCEAAGGVAPYSYRWQSYTGEEPNPWEDLTEGVDGYYQTNQPTLIILYPDDANEHRHQCVATDSNFGGSVAESASASLQVRDAAVGDRFSNGPGQVMGDPLDGTTPDFGDGEWWAEEGTVFGIDSITNAVTNPVSDKIIGKLEVPDAIAATYKSLSVQAELTIGEADWVGVGFAHASPYGLMASGELWAMVTSSGRVKVFANAQAYTLFDQAILSPEELEAPIHLLVEHDDETNSTHVWVNHEEILDADLDGLRPPYVPPLSAVGFQATLYSGFTEPGVVRIDDFALTGDVEVSAPTMAVNPQSQQVGLGFDPQLTCGATGGVPPYCYSWERYNGFAGWLELEEGHPFSGTATSTLTVSDFDLSLEGSYRCTVRDGRAEPASVSSASATLTTVLPNFDVDFDYGYGMFVWATLVSDGTPAGHFRVGVPYDLHFQARSGVAVAPDLDVPVRIWAQCHSPKDVDGPWSLLAETNIRFPAVEGDFTATMTVPEDCIPEGQAWKFASLFIDINAESDPIQPDGYPDEIYLARSIVAEADVLWNNRWVSRNWAPVVSADIASLGQMFGQGSSVILVKDFTSTGDLPDPTLYPSAWTGAQGPYVFDEMQVSMSVDFGQNPHEVIPETFEPYVAWETGVQAQPIAAIVRYRRVGYHVWDDELYFGSTAHPPPVSPNEYPVRLGSPEGDGDSTNIVPTERFGHYRVAVWERPGGPFQDEDVGDPYDGVGFIETPEIPVGSYPPTDDLHVYLGYQHACMNHDPPFGYGPCQAPPGQAWHRYFLIDYVAVWGDAPEPPPGDPPVDYSAIDLVVQDLNGWITLPELVPLGEEYRVCVLIDADQDGASPPNQVRVSHQEVPAGALIDHPAAWVENLPGGEFVFCPQQGGTPVTWTAVIRGDYQHVGAVDDPDDLNPNNDLKTRVVSTSCPIPDVDLP